MQYDVAWRYYALYDNGTQAELQVSPSSFKEELEALLFKYTRDALLKAGDREVIKVGLDRFEAPMWYNVVPEKK